MKLKNATLETLEAEIGRRMKAAVIRGDVGAMAELLTAIENLACYCIIALGYDEAKSMEGVDYFSANLAEKVTYFIYRKGIKIN